MKGKNYGAAHGGCHDGIPWQHAEAQAPLTAEPAADSSTEAKAETDADVADADTGSGVCRRWGILRMSFWRKSFRGNSYPGCI